MLRIVTPPASYPVTLDEAKAQLRVVDGSNDAIISGLIPAATKFCQSLVQRAFVLQTMEWVMLHWRDDMCLPIAPVLADGILSVKYVDWATESQTTLDPSLYVVQTIGGPCVRLVPAFGSFWPPAFARSPEPIVIQFDAGYEDPVDLPGNIKAAILLQLRHLYSMGAKDMTLARDIVYGIGEQSFLVAPNLMTLIPNAVRDLLLDEVW